MRPSQAFAFVLISVAMAASACSPTDLPGGLGATVEQIDAIRNDSNLTPQQKREELRRLGIDDVTINGLLVSERLGNQFGGDLASALTKVTENRMNDLTPDEVQSYGDATGVTQYTDAEAQAISDLLRDHSITSRTSLEDFLDDASTELPAAINENNLRAIFVDFDIDDVRDELP